MNALLLVRASMVASVASLILCGGCQGEVHVNASSDANERTEAPPAAAAPAPAQPPPAPVTAAPPADACPLLCYEARGPFRAEMTAEEVAQLRSALEPVLGRLRACASSGEQRSQRAHGTPMLNLRIAPDGTLADMGVDPGHGLEGTCFDNAGRNASASVALPGRKVVRCAERCVRESPRVAIGRRRRGQ